MKLFPRIFISLLLSFFVLFLASPLFALAGESQSTVVLSNTISDICSSNIQCEEVSIGEYICSSTGENLSGQGGSIHHIPVGRCEADIRHHRRYLQVSFQGVIRDKKIIYIGPDTFVYPFVRIIKIQV